MFTFDSLLTEQRNEMNVCFEMPCTLINVLSIFYCTSMIFLNWKKIFLELQVYSVMNVTHGCKVIKKLDVEDELDQIKENTVPLKSSRYPWDESHFPLSTSWIWNKTNHIKSQITQNTQYLTSFIITKVHLVHKILQKTLTLQKEVDMIAFFKFIS